MQRRRQMSVVPNSTASDCYLCVRLHLACMLICTHTLNFGYYLNLVIGYYMMKAGSVLHMRNLETMATLILNMVDTQVVFLLA